MSPALQSITHLMTVPTFYFIKITLKINVFEEVQVVLFDLFVQMLTEQDTDTDINVS